MTTPIPKPAYRRLSDLQSGIDDCYLLEQLIAHGAAKEAEGYKRGIKFAVSRCMYRSHRNDDMGAIIASDILNLGEAT